MLRVVRLEYERDTNYARRVLDVDDDEVAARYFATRVQVSDLSFNERAGYLCHQDSLEEVELLQGPDA